MTPTSVRRLLHHQDQSSMFNKSLDSGMHVPKIPIDKRNSADLGPIGQPRRSSNTNWEMGAKNVPKPTPTMSNMYSNLPRSRFLDSLQTNQSAERLALMGQDSSSSYLEELWAIYNHQQQFQQQQLQQQQQQQQQELNMANWQTNSMWTPMGYTSYQQQQQAPPGWPIRPPPGLLQQNPISQPEQNQPQEMPTYDPFKSLSYLWDNKKQQ